jgi:hypothetical protein
MPAVGAGVLERAAAGGLEGRPAGAVGLQVELVAHDDGDEDIVHVQAVAAEHALRTHRAQRRQQLGAPARELVPVR